MSTQAYWNAVTHRDKALDGRFVYAVRSTGIYCRPSCPSRKPKQENVTFFSLPELAERAGYRACKRCDPGAAGSPQVRKVRRVCRYLEEHFEEAPSLNALAKRFNLSPSQLQRSFKEVVGVTPKAYRDSCRLDALKGSLRQGDPVSRALYEVGYGSSSRLYSQSDAQLGMTPKTYQQRGKGMHVRYTVAQSPLGQLLVAATDKGICSVRLADKEKSLVEEVQSEFAQAELARNDASLEPWIAKILAHLAGKEPHLELPLDVRATAFQKQVWQALRNIPYGETRSYQQVAQAVGKPKAVRAVAGACAANPTALVIPCHRVVRSDGSLSGYRWGVERKEALLEGERALKGQGTEPSG